MTPTTPFHADEIHKQGQIDGMLKLSEAIINDFVENPPKSMNCACKRIRTAQMKLKQGRQI